MTDYQDYMNTHKLYPDDISRRIDVPPGFDSLQDAGIKPMEHKSARIAVDDLPVGATVKESLTTEPTQIDRIKKLEKEVEQLTKYFERFARLNRLGLPEVEV